jgi:dihydrofolate reductase
MKTQYYAAASLDGFIATENDSLEWLFPLGNVNETSYPAFIAEVGALAMGSTTYEWMLRNADKMVAETGSVWPYTQPAWIFSRRALPTVSGANMRFVRGDVRPVHAEMRKGAGSKNIWIVGGGDLAGQFRCRPAGRDHCPGGFGHPGEGQAAVPATRHESASAPGFRPAGRDRLRSKRRVRYAHAGRYVIFDPCLAIAVHGRRVRRTSLRSTPTGDNDS